MRIGPLTLFQRRHSNGTPIREFTVAALHWSWSLTWRWLIVWSPDRRVRKLHFKVVRIYRGYPRSWLNFTAVMGAPLLGQLHIQTQPNMQKSGKRK